jgi:K+-sensing histidine kinase KdpD
MDRTVVNLVDLGAIRDGQLEPKPRVVDLAPMITEVVRENSSTAGGKTIFLDIEAGVSFPVRCDPLHLERILRNLVADAIERSPETGRVTVAVKAAGERVRVEISDSGPGRDIDALTALLDRPQPPEFDSNSFDLALYVAARLAAANRARAEVSRDEAAGFIVTLDMPAASPP